MYSQGQQPTDLQFDVVCQDVGSPDTQQADDRPLELYERVKKQLNRFFWFYGQLVTRHPLPFLITPVVVCGLLSCGILRLKRENDPVALYFPSNTRTAEDKQLLYQLYPEDLNREIYSYFAQKTYPLFFRIIFLSKNESESLLDGAANEELRRLYSEIKLLKDKDGNSLDDVCARYRNSCVEEGGQVLSPLFQGLLRQGFVRYPLSTLPDGRQVDLSSFIARPHSQLNESKDNAVLTGAGVLKVTWVLAQDNDWSDTAIRFTQSVNLACCSLVLEGTRSLPTELDRSTQGDLFLFVLTLVFATIYSIFSTAGSDMVSSRGTLAVVGVLATGLGILGSAGLLGLCGLQSANVVGIMPFLILGIGVDDMFLLMSSWSQTLDKTRLTVAQRLSLTLTTAGVGVTVTSVTDFLAFLVGSASGFLSVKIFCIYTGVTVMVVYLNQVTMFVACLSLHGRRVYDGRHCVTCRRVTSVTEGKQLNRFHRLLCTGKIPSKARHDESFLEKLPRKVIPRLLAVRWVRYVLLVAFLVLASVSLYGFERLQEGIELQNLVYPDSYYRQFIQVLLKYFQDQSPISFIVAGEIDYAGQEGQLLLDILTKAKQDELIQENVEHCWLSSYRNSTFYANNTTHDFYSGLVNFLQEEPVFLAEMRFHLGNISSGRILTSSCSVQTLKIGVTLEAARLMERMRFLSDNSGLPVYVFPYHFSFMTYEGMLHTYPNTMWTLGVAVIAMVIVTIIFLPQPFMVLLVTFNILMILGNIMGSMYFMGITLSVVTMIHLIMSVGFSVDFSAHVCSAYLMSNAPGRAQRAVDAVTHAASPVMNGALSSLVGVSFLLFSGSYIFTTFFKIMVMVIVYGMLNAVLFVPIVLSMVGPQRNDHPYTPGTTLVVPDSPNSHTSDNKIPTEKRKSDNSQSSPLQSESAENPHESPTLMLKSPSPKSESPDLKTDNAALKPNRFGDCGPYSVVTEDTIRLSQYPHHGNRDSTEIHDFAVRMPQK